MEPLEKTLYEELAIAREDMKLKNDGKAFRKDLVDLMDLIRDMNPSTVFFIDRSARPVAWMVYEILSQLRLRGELDLPDIRFISFDNRYEVSEVVIDKARRKFKHTDSRSLLVVDEFTESFNGNYRCAAEILKQVFSTDEVVGYPFRVRGRRYIPFFYKISDENKTTLYGIGDTHEGSLVSEAAERNPEVMKYVREFRGIFKKFARGKANLIAKRWFKNGSSRASALE